MILKSEIEEVYLSQKEYFEKKDIGLERDFLNSIRLDTDFVTIITGIRRSGKSTFLKQLIKRRIENACFLTFEDPRLISFEFKDFNKLKDVFRESGENTFYIFDEIQNIQGWEIFVRAQQDEGRKIIITGSNASLLSKELGTRLTGRHLNYELFPFSYNEYVKFYDLEKNALSFKEYLNNGGFPEFLKYKEEEILYRLSDDILYRDIAVRYGIKHHKLLKQILLYLITNSGKLFSYNKLKKVFSTGSPNTIIDYISYFEDSYLLFVIPRFSYSLKKQIYNPHKVYTIDTGLANVLSLSFSEDLGRKFENIIFIHLRKKYKNIFYFAGQNECDFLIFEKGRVTKAIQVCYELTADNIKRELDGLWEALNETNLKQGIILTYDQEDHFVKDDMKATVVPAWKYLADKDVD